MKHSVQPPHLISSGSGHGNQSVRPVFNPMHASRTVCTVSHPSAQAPLQAHTHSIADEHNSSHYFSRLMPMHAKLGQPVIEIDPQHQLDLYIQSGDLKAIMQAEQKDPGLIHRAIANGVHLLHIAVGYEQTSIVEFLIGKAVNIQAADYANNRPLTLAFHKKNLLLVYILINSGAAWDTKLAGNRELLRSLDSAFINTVTYMIDLYYTRKKGISRSQSLHVDSINQAVIQSMTSSDFQTKDLSVAMTLACKNNKNEWLPFLLELSISLDARDSHGKTALDYLCDNKNMAGLEILMHSKYWNFLSVNVKMDVLTVFYQENNIRMINVLIKKEGINTQLFEKKLQALNFDSSRLSSPLTPDKSHLNPEAPPFQPKALALSLPIKPNAPYSLHAACRTGTFKEVSRLLTEDPQSIHQFDTTNNFPIHIAASRHQLDIVNLLLSHKADYMKQNGLGFLPIHCAISAPATDANQQLNVIKKLMSIQDNSKVNVNYHDSLLHLAVTCEAIEVIQYLAAKFKALINYSDSLKMTALMIAANKPSPLCSSIINILLQNDANPNLKNKYGFTCLHLACFNNNIPAVQSLISVSDLSIENNQQVTVLLSALQSKNTQLLDFLIPHFMKKKLLLSVDKAKNNLLHLICLENFYDAMLVLTQHVSSISIFETRNNFGQTPFHIACKKGSKSMVITLIKNGFHFEHLDNFGETPFTVACRYGTYEMIEMLLTYEINLKILKEAYYRGLKTALYNKNLNNVISLLNRAINKR